MFYFHDMILYQTNHREAVFKSIKRKIHIDKSNFAYHFRIEWSVFHDDTKYEKKFPENEFSQQKRKEKSLSLLSLDVG